MHSTLEPPPFSEPPGWRTTRGAISLAALAHQGAAAAAVVGAGAAAAVAPPAPAVAVA
eukprot:CAMPEP_0176073262 /NCGR_PEP_ID=MMETSP0120_2-20121206/36605_1 /TAXON_ID=160619 /ORGANISM="Kryptoperidinium foliaceum, Strain CCMP 1326" /LENGTH=57 /DNA_ID=CAMNT_0017406943 /DNA_START=358 /DNA_END=527 /DNA_ORIENTATION=-